MPSIFFCMYKIYLISAEGYKNADVHFLRVQKADKIWASIKNSKDGRGVKSMSDLILKEIYDICETENLTEEQIKKYKMTEREFFEKYDKLTKDELNTKSNKNVYVRNDNMTTVIKSCRGVRKIDGLRKKLMIPESPEHEVKSKIGNINEKILEEYSVKVYEINPYFKEHYKKKLQVIKNGCEYILFRTDVYYNEYLLAVESNERTHVDRDLIFEEKRQKALEKKLGCKFIRINTSKEGYDADYEVNRIQTFIIKFRERQLKQSNKKIKEAEDKIKKLKL